eukprot:TRINITY_DN81030_c0_g1_i1.p1 TRINITY_DN81030_c0_g1~~TRINITY_DN81030_c0_g1_i1.p1  ORF type:complete len:920 (+),score=122.99 TRINITY_DN81030_c0_g1_i1:74-2833(+)
MTAPSTAPIQRRAMSLVHNEQAPQGTPAVARTLLNASTPVSAPRVFADETEFARPPASIPRTSPAVHRVAPISAGSAEARVSPMQVRPATGFVRQQSPGAASPPVRRPATSLERSTSPAMARAIVDAASVPQARPIPAAAVPFDRSTLNVWQPTNNGSTPSASGERHVSPVIKNSGSVERRAATTIAAPIRPGTSASFERVSANMPARTQVLLSASGSVERTSQPTPGIASAQPVRSLERMERSFENPRSLESDVRTPGKSIDEYLRDVQNRPKTAVIPRAANTVEQPRAVEYSGVRAATTVERSAPVSSTEYRAPVFQPRSSTSSLEAVALPQGENTFSSRPLPSSVISASSSVRTIPANGTYIPSPAPPVSAYQVPVSGGYAPPMTLRAMPKEDYSSYSEKLALFEKEVLDFRKKLAPGQDRVPVLPDIPILDDDSEKVKPKLPPTRIVAPASVVKPKELPQSIVTYEPKTSSNKALPSNRSVAAYPPSTSRKLPETADVAEIQFARQPSEFTMRALELNQNITAYQLEIFATSASHVCTRARVNLTEFPIQTGPGEVWIELQGSNGNPSYYCKLYIEGFYRLIRPIDHKMTKLFVNVIDAREIRSEDWMGSSDPYVLLRFREQQCVTTMKEDCNNPIWNEEFCFELGRNTAEEDEYLSETDKKLEVLLYDADMFFDDILAVFHIDVKELNLHLGPQTREIQMDHRGQYAGTIRLQFRAEFTGSQEITAAERTKLGGVEVTVKDAVVRGTSRGRVFVKLVVEQMEVQTEPTILTENPVWGNTYFKFPVDGHDPVLEVFVYEEDSVNVAQLAKTTIHLSDMGLAAYKCDKWFQLEPEGRIRLEMEGYFDKCKGLQTEELEDLSVIVKDILPALGETSAKPPHLRMRLHEESHDVIPKVEYNFNISDYRRNRLGRGNAA